MFGTREEFLAYEEALKLENRLNSLLESNSNEKRHASKKSGLQNSQNSLNDHAVNHILYNASLWLACYASDASHDPFVVITERMERKRALEKRKKFSSVPDSSFPSIAEELDSAFPLFKNALETLCGKSRIKEENEGNKDCLEESEPDHVNSHETHTFSSLPFPAVDAPCSSISSTPSLDSTSCPLLSSSSPSHAPLLFTVPTFHCDCTQSKRYFSLVRERPFLARFGEGWIYARMLHHSIVYLEKQKLYSKACALLRLLLTTPFCPGKSHSLTQLRTLI